MNVFEKYGLPLLGEYIKGMSELEISENNATKDYYTIFLTRTDYITNKLVEGAIKTEDCTDELYYREVARQEIARLNGETPASIENKKTLEERATQNEADTAVIAMMSDIDLEG